MRVLTIQQPHYLPWLGYFEQIRVSDEFLLLDDVQWTKQGRQHRSPLLQQNGERLWLTIPVESEGHREKTIKDMRIAENSAWAKNHWQSIQTIYGKSPFFRTQLEPLLKPWFEGANKHKFLIDVLETSLEQVAKALELPHSFAKSSNFGVESKSSERLAELCEIFQADVYYSSLGSTRYLDYSLFRAVHVRVITQHWNPPDALSNLSIVHALATMSLEELRLLIEPKAWGAFADRMNPQLLPPPQVTEPINQGIANT